MNTFKILRVAAIAILISSTATAATDDQNQNSSNMPMMEQNKEGMMMSPGMQHGMMDPEQYHNMPMMTPQMMHMMMHSMHSMNSMGGHGQGNCQQQGMPMMGGGMGYNMMNPQMMQMRMQHMTNMAKRLENIEALLSQLVELQQKN